MKVGSIPLITTSERNNGISTMVDSNNAYEAGKITISANGSSCCAHYHDYKFIANSDVHVCTLKEGFDDKCFALFLCASINNESWRFDYSRKLSKKKLESLSIKVPVRPDDEIDFKVIKKDISKVINEL